ncbi:hypothetical protein T4E_1695 [Trichinella pseudospiralis]|uniref:Apple domain-containing protein n=1 Tax=Trichinella pseudospiralis TaxID=6337 RepID=A0A0V0XX20_TRIPS|nr:hypothetical protein T4E_1695 [Trichinella pseudospiralis]
MFFIFRGCEIAIKTTHNISYELISESRATIGNFIYLLLFPKPCKSTLFAAYLNDAQMTCILDQRKVSSSLLQAFDMQVELGKSFEECITMCYLLHPEKKCSAVKYFQTLIKCYLFAIHINATELETEDESLEIIYLVFGGTFILLQTGTLDKEFIIERRPVVDSMHSEFLLHDQKESISNCIVYCYIMKIGCNAIIYNTRAGWCTLLKHETPTLPVTVEQYESRLMFLLHLTLPWNVKLRTIYHTNCSQKVEPQQTHEQ